MDRILILILILVVASGCSQSTSTSSSFQVNLSGITAGETFAGGGYIRVKALGGTAFTEYELKTTNVIDLPRGKWEIYFVGFQGAADWSGPYKCGVATPVVLDQDAQTVNISATSANCPANTIYMSMIVTKNPSAAGVWDTGNWDTALWAP